MQIIARSVSHTFHGVPCLWRGVIYACARRGGPLNVERLSVAGMSNESHGKSVRRTSSNAGVITMNSSWYRRFSVKRNSLGRRIPGLSLVPGIVVGTRWER